jgi:ABC-type transport system involved in multi-copper enzyme maturation permease subunit
MESKRYLILELKKLFRFPTIRKAAYFAWGCAALVAISPLFISGLSSLNWSELFLDAFQLGLFVTNLGMIVTAAQFIAAEYDNRTIDLIVSHGITRKLFIIGKGLALIVGTYAIVLGILFVAFVISSIIGMMNGHFYVGDVSYLHMFSTLLFAPLKVFPMMVISLLLTTFWRTSIFPIAFLVFYASFGELLLTVLMRGTRFANLIPYLPEQIIKPIDSITVYQISNELGFNTLQNVNENMATLSLTTWQSGIGILAYIALCLSLSYLIFSRQDL